MKRKSKINAAEKAFTLTELVVTVTIIAALAGSAVVASVDTVDMKADLTARKVLSSVSLAKVYAFSMRESHWIIFDTTHNRISIEDSLGRVVWNPATFSPCQWELEDGRIRTVDFGGGDRLGFGSLGDALSGGTVTVDYPGLLQTFVFSPITGRVSIGEVRN